ncbi:uncharacterized protein LOC131290992 [Anopheles ziemanni]|uniref:uncharacterized protein LOC131269162 n=1 Tax=Anopheles coustani TaxID=139045 RepID=UPI00265A2ED0|nr:uncharacterized protein LOC131269162 [Anopheles coustani]XP_058176167.1 uncharacterized protein LOC131290992 [Anopheles ziemanni]
MRVTATCLLLALLLAARVEASLRNNFAPQPSTYCQAPRDNAVLPPDFHAACKRHSEGERDKLTQAYEVLLKHVAGLMSETGPVTKAVRPFLNALGRRTLNPPLGPNAGLRKSTMVAAIEAGRLAEAMTLYLESRGWEDWRSVVDRIFAKPRRHRQNIENLIAFVRMLPARQEQLEFYHHLRSPLVTHKYHEGYLGALFANGARWVVFADDGKTVRNQTDERLLWTTMVDAAGGYFKRIFLSADNIVDLASLDRDFPDEFTMLLPTIFNVTKNDLRFIDPWKMIELPCEMDRSHSKLMMFQEMILVLQRHFTWVNQNHIHSRWLALRFKDCLPKFGKDSASQKLINSVKDLFGKFEKGVTYETLIKPR